MSKANKRPSQLDSPVVGQIIKYVSRAHAWIYRKTSGAVGINWRIGSALRKPVRTLLLHHRGRRSGKSFIAPLLYLPDGDNIVVVASQGGLANHPQWYFNLRHNPDTTVQIGKQVLPVRARVAQQQERAALWPKLVELYADFDTYQAWTDREIPVVILEPRG